MNNKSNCTTKFQLMKKLFSQPGQIEANISAVDRLDPELSKIQMTRISCLQGQLLCVFHASLILIFKIRYRPKQVLAQLPTCWQISVAKSLGGKIQNTVLNVTVSHNKTCEFSDPTGPL